MATPRDCNPFTFLQKANSSAKYKRAITLSDMGEALRRQDVFVRMNDRGLFIALMSELINYHYHQFTLRIKAFYHQLCPPVKAIRKKKEEDGERPPKRHRKPRVNVENVDIQQLASESISNPSNLQALRGREHQKDRGRDRQTLSNEKLKDPIIVDFEAALQRLGDIGGDIGGDIVDIHPEQHIIGSNEDSSRSNSTKASSNLIPNLAQKLKILGGDVSFEKRTVQRRRVGVAGTTVRRKDISIIDISISLNETQPSVNLRSVPEAVLKERCRALQITKKSQGFQKLVRNMAEQVKERFFSDDTMRRLRDFEKIRRRQGELNVNIEAHMDFSQEQSLFDTQFGAPPSTYASGKPDDSNFNRVVQEHLDSNLFKGQESLTLTKLQAKIRHPKDEIFTKLLHMAYRGEVRMIQQNPSQFGQITVSLIAA